MRSPATPSSGDTPQRPEKRSGADVAHGPARRSCALLRARRLTRRPARTLNRRSWFHVQAWKVDKPRLCACTSKVVTFASLQGAVFCLGNLAGRSRDAQHQQVE